MEAIGNIQSLPINDQASLINLSQPTATGYDLLVKVTSIPVNPVDYKTRQNVANFTYTDFFLDSYDG